MDSPSEVSFTFAALRCSRTVAPAKVGQRAESVAGASWNLQIYAVILLLFYFGGIIFEERKRSESENRIRAVECAGNLFSWRRARAIIRRICENTRLLF